VTAVVAVLVAAAAVAAVVVARDGDHATLPECARPAATIDRPHQLPTDFPVPRGTVFTSVTQNVISHGVPLVKGVMPVDLERAGRFIDVDLRGAAKIMDRRQEPGRQVSAHYNVPGFGGFVEISALRGCPEATALSVTVRPTLYGRGAAQ